MGIMWHLEPIGALKPEYLEWIYQQGVDNLPDGTGSRYPTPNEIRQVLDSLGDCRVRYGIRGPGEAVNHYFEYEDRWELIEVVPEWGAVVTKKNKSQITQIEGMDFTGDEDKPLNFYFDRGSGELALRITEKLSSICGPFIFGEDGIFPIVVTPGIDVKNSFKPIIPNNEFEISEFIDKTVEKALKDLQSENKDIRFKAVVSLGTCQAKQTVDYLIPLLQDNDTVIRAHSAEVLGLIGDIKALEPLIQTLNDEDWQVRWRVVDALCRLNEPYPLGALRNLLQSEPQSEVRQAIIETIDNLENPTD